jgi:hypothetical protein
MNKACTSALLLLFASTSATLLVAQAGLSNSSDHPNFGYVVLESDKGVLGTAVSVPATSCGGGVTVTSPQNGATVPSPVHFQASATASNGNYIISMQILVDGVSKYQVNAASLDTQLAVATGKHNIVVEASDNLGTLYKSSVVAITVTNGVIVTFKGCVFNQNGHKYQAVNLHLSQPATLPFNAMLYYGTTCNPNNFADQFGFGQNLSLGTLNYIFWFSDFADQMNMSALWSLGNQTSQCVNYMTAPNC